jgi:hypothetical protein
MKERCQGIWGFLFGHNFEEHSNEEEGEGKWPFTIDSYESKVSALDADKILYATKSHKETYLFSSCTRCGKIVKEEGK